MRLVRLPVRDLVGAALLAIAPCGAIGQTPCPDTVAHADTGALVVIVARVHADAVVFETVPETRVTLNGCEPRGDQVRHSSNLPDPVEPGVRYTNVEVSAEYRLWLNVECRAPADVAARLCEAIGATRPIPNDTVSSRDPGIPSSTGRRD